MTDYPLYSHWIALLTSLDNVYVALAILALIGVGWACYARWSLPCLLPVVRVAAPLFVWIGILISGVVIILR